MSRKTVVFGVLSSALVLSACGGGGGSTSVGTTPGFAAATLEGFHATPHPDAVAAVSAFNNLNSQTAATNLPTSGTAIYSGQNTAIVNVRDGGAIQAQYLGDVTLSATFTGSGGTIFGDITSLQSAAAGSSPPSGPTDNGIIRIGGPISGSSFAEDQTATGSPASNINGDAITAIGGSGVFVGTDGKDILGRFGGSLASGDSFDGFYSADTP